MTALWRFKLCLVSFPECWSHASMSYTIIIVDYCESSAIPPTCQLQVRITANVATFAAGASVAGEGFSFWYVMREGGGRGRGCSSWL